MRFPTRPALAVTCALALPPLAPVARANERHFTFTYESAVLPRGAREIEVWATSRLGRERWYAGFDQRIELEVGVTDRLLSAFYLDASGASAEDASGTRSATSELRGVASEWKLKLSDPVADGVGLALYAEASAGPTASELEAKLILDKVAGKLLLAANLAGANEWDHAGAGTGTEQEAEVHLAAAYLFRSGLSAGLEVRNHSAIEDGEWEHSALFAGPVVAYGAEGWWVAASVLPQLPALKKRGGGDRRVLDELEKVDARVLVSFDL